MFITTRYSYETTRGRQQDLDQWLATVYGEATPTTTLELCPHSRGFYHTRTYQGQMRHTSGQVAIIQRCQQLLETFHEQHPEPYEEMYDTFFIPKTSGGQRRIDAPKDYLKDTMLQLKTWLEQDMQLQYHDCCYSYFHGRGTKDALRVHQANESKWFAKFDMKDFFPNTTKEFILQQLDKLFPFHHFLGEQTWTQQVIKDIIDLCMYNGGLPQGTPMSPMLTNLIMIPIDYEIATLCYVHGRFVYTRYADDILISSKYEFDHQYVENLLKGVLRAQNAPFTINEAKTRYGSSAGSNWNLGLMLNKDNRITIGHRKKQVIRATVNNFLKDFTSGHWWSTIDTQSMMGEISYLRNVESDYADYIVHELEIKHQLNFRETVKTVLRAPEIEVPIN